MPTSISLTSSGSEVLSLFQDGEGDVFRIGGAVFGATEYPMLWDGSSASAHDQVSIATPGGTVTVASSGEITWPFASASGLDESITLEIYAVDEHIAHPDLRIQAQSITPVADRLRAQFTIPAFEVSIDPSAIGDLTTIAPPSGQWVPGPLTIEIRFKYTSADPENLEWFNTRLPVGAHATETAILVDAHMNADGTVVESHAGAWAGSIKFAGYGPSEAAPVSFETPTAATAAWIALADFQGRLLATADNNVHAFQVA